MPSYGYRTLSLRYCVLRMARGTMATRPSVKLGYEKCPAGHRPLRAAWPFFFFRHSRVATLRETQETRVPGIKEECTVILWRLFS